MVSLSRFSTALIASLTLAACGGGGGGSTSQVPSRIPTPPTDREVTPNPGDGDDSPSLTDIVIPASSPSFTKIAKAIPRPGSITQSSNVDKDGITLDRVTLTRKSSNNSMDFTISNQGKWKHNILHHELKYTDNDYDNDASRSYTSNYDSFHSTNDRSYPLESFGRYFEKVSEVEYNNTPSNHRRPYPSCSDTSEGVCLIDPPPKKLNDLTYYLQERYILKNGFNRKFEARQGPPVKYRDENGFQLEQVIRMDAVTGYYRESDYLTLGWWAKGTQHNFRAGPYDATERDYIIIDEFGSYVTGGDKFIDSNMPSSGKATYQGFGDLIIYPNETRIKTGNIKQILGKSSLTADFKNRTFSGIISNMYTEVYISENTENSEREHYASRENYFPGTNIVSKEWVSRESPVNNSGSNIIRYYDKVSVPGKIILNNTKIDNTHSGFFTGNLTGSVEDKTYKGVYGGQFYGNGETDGKPGTVAGTGAGISNDGSYILKGIWMGDKINK